MLSTPHCIAFQRSGMGRVADRQDQSYAHQVMPAPDARHIYVCDLGADQIHVLTVGARARDARHTTSLAVPDGSGPRHLVFFEQTAYVAMELSREVQAYAYDGEHLTPQGPPVAVQPPQAQNGSLAEIAVSPDGAYVYVSCRGDPREDVLAVLPRSPSSLGTPAFCPCGGRVPRHFSLSPDARWVVVANQGSETLALLSRDAHTGAVHVVATHEAGPINYAGF